MLRNTVKTLQYGSEILLRRADILTALNNVGEKDVVDYLKSFGPTRTSAMGTVGMMLYDMVIDKQNYDERIEIGKDTSKIILLLDLVDDIVDERLKTIPEKKSFMSGIESTVLKGERKSYHTIEERASSALANSIYKELVPLDTQGTFSRTMQDLVRTATNQLTAENDEAYSTTAKLWSLCFEMTALPLELKTKRNYPHLRAMTRKFGESLSLWDSFYDLDDDLRDGTITHATAKIIEKGNSPTTRFKLKEETETLSETLSSEARGLLLTEQERTIFDALKTLFDIKYHGLRGLHSRTTLSSKGYTAQDKNQLHPADQMYTQHLSQKLNHPLPQSQSNQL